jgi:membrane-associated phospholipid phosphatase
MQHAIWSFVTDFGDTAVTVPLALLMASALAAARHFRMALGWCVAILACAGSIAGLKLALAVCGHQSGASALASPSGHTALSTAVYGGFAVVFGAQLERPARHALLAAAAALMLGIAASRAVLQYHTVTEVAVGLAVGSLALAGIVALTSRYRPARLPILPLAATALAVALIFHGARWPAEHAVRRLGFWLEVLAPLCR